MKNVFNFFAHPLGYEAIPVEQLYVLFEGMRKVDTNEQLKKSTDQYLQALQKLSDSVNCFQTENNFMHAWIDLKFKIEQLNPSAKFAFIKIDTLKDIARNYDGFLVLTTILDYPPRQVFTDESGCVREGPITTIQAQNAMDNSLTKTRLNGYYFRLGEFLEGIPAVEKMIKTSYYAPNQNYSIEERVWPDYLAEKFPETFEVPKFKK